MGRDCASERVPIALAEADQRTTSERRHQRRLTSPPLPSRGYRSPRLRMALRRSRTAASMWMRHWPS